MGSEADVAAILASLACGVIFGFGLLISGLAQPHKVLAFLDVLGPWDPTLAIVMAAALAVTSAGYTAARRRESPLLTAKFSWPTRTDIDAPLTIGAMLFGVGWGLVGLCPGPALVNLATLSPQVVLFVVAMTGGIVAHDWAVASIRKRDAGVLSVAQCVVGPSVGNPIAEQDRFIRGAVPLRDDQADSL
jgi:uncharacterized protein